MATAGRGEARGQAAAGPALRSAAEAQELVLEVLRAHAESLLTVARRHSLCLDDAHDAYQRTVEIFLRHAARLDARDAYKWVHTVCKHEAMGVRQARLRIVGSEEADLDAREARDLPAPEEQVLRFERLTRSAEALQRLKPQELRALWLSAQGHSYQEIADLEGWTYTKVNRCITEGRRSFLDRYRRIETGVECRRWEPVLSALVDGEATARQLAQVRPHLRNCAGCRATVRALREQSAGLAALLPVPTLAAAATAAEPLHRHVEATGGLLARLHDALVGPLQERAAMSAIKLQGGVEAMTAGKVAAVAASAAAIAGGGVAVERAATDRADRAAERARPLARSAAARPAAAAVTVSASTRVAPPPKPPAPAAPPAPEVRRKRTSSAEFGFGGRRRARTSSATSTASREFASSQTASATAASTSSPDPAPAPAPAPAESSSAVQTAAAEFGG